MNGGKMFHLIVSSWEDLILCRARASPLPWIAAALIALYLMIRHVKRRNRRDMG